MMVRKNHDDAIPNDPLRLLINNLTQTNLIQLFPTDIRLFAFDN